MNTRIEEAKKRVKDMRTFKHTCDRCDNLIVCKGTPSETSIYANDEVYMRVKSPIIPKTYKCSIEGKKIIKPTDEECLKFCCRNYRRDV